MPIIFSIIYRILIYIEPHSFKGLGSNSHYFDCVYFSFVTFTTTGIGDMYPISTLAKVVVTSEVIIGILSIAFIVYFYAKRSSAKNHDKV